MSGQELVIVKALELSAQLKRLSTHSHLELLHFFMVCVLFRKDSQYKNGGLFPRDFKLAGWLMSILMCFSDSIISNVVIGEPLVTPFKKHEKILIASLIWYLVNYSPRDLIFKLSQLKLVALISTWFWTLGLIGKIGSGVQYGSKHFPSYFFIIALLGICKGSGHLLMGGLLKVVNGTYKETDNQIMYPSFQLKCNVFTAILFTMFKNNYFTARTPFVYLGVVFLYLYSSISSIMSPCGGNDGGGGGGSNGVSGSGDIDGSSVENNSNSNDVLEDRSESYRVKEDVFSPIENVLTFLFFNNPLLNSHYYEDKNVSSGKVDSDGVKSDGDENIEDTGNDCVDSN